MITLANKEKVHAAFILPRENGMKPHGLVLASRYDGTDTEYITWSIYSNGEMVDGQEIWECEQGHYFMPVKGIDNRAHAERDFGQRFNHLLPRSMFLGLIASKG